LSVQVEIKVILDGKIENIRVGIFFETLGLSQAHDYSTVAYFRRRVEPFVLWLQIILPVNLGYLTSNKYSKIFESISELSTHASKHVHSQTIICAHGYMCSRF